MLNADMIYEAADYLRLSKEDGDFSLSNDKLESDSISSQRANDLSLKIRISSW